MKGYIKSIYSYVYKFYNVILFVFFLGIGIIILWRFIIQYFLYKEKNEINKIDIKTNTQYALCKPFDVVNIGNSEDIIYLNILRKQFSFYKDEQLTTVYNYSVLSSNALLYTILYKCSNGTINTNDVKQLITQYPILQNLSFGQILSCLVLDKSKIKYLIWKASAKKIYIYNNVNNFFTEGFVKILTRSNDGSYYTILFVGKLNGTFINSVRALGVEENCIIDTVKALQYQLDFKKLHHGDQFSILVSLIIDNDKKLKSQLIAARLFTSSKNYYIFKLDNGKFFNKDAIQLGNNFIRSPILEPYRISSNFNLRRLNPITGQISPHAGVDFAVPIGTPVISVGDGEVMISKYSKVAGNYVAIKHNYQCITRYMHLKKNLVKKGQKVKKGEQIGLSGNTGRSTGPHLHFEIWINHRPVNPLKSNIINLDKLINTERIQFLHQIEKIIPKLSFD